MKSEITRRKIDSLWICRQICFESSVGRIVRYLGALVSPNNIIDYPGVTASTVRGVDINAIIIVVINCVVCNQRINSTKSYSYSGIIIIKNIIVKFIVLTSGNYNSGSSVPFVNTGAVVASAIAVEYIVAKCPVVNGFILLEVVNCIGCIVSSIRVFPEKLELGYWVGGLASNQFREDHDGRGDVTLGHFNRHSLGRWFGKRENWRARRLRDEKFPP